MYAVIKTGGKQYRVAAQDIIEIEKLTGEPGTKVEFDEVLMVGSLPGEGGGEPRFGAPTVSGVKVTAEVVRQGRGEKVIIFKKRRRHTFRRKKGHRQELTTVRITAING
jgi:large subunit ribosomal protein L21